MILPKKSGFWKSLRKCGPAPGTIHAMKQIRATVIAALFLCAQACQASGSDQALALLKKAHDLTDIRSLGSLYLSATFKIKRADGAYSGKYQLIWVSEEKWRDEVVMGNYVQVRIGSEGRVYQRRNMSDPQGFADSVTSLVDISRYLQPWPGETYTGVKSVKKRNPSAVDAQCSIFRPANSGFKYDAACVETASGKPISARGGMVQYTSYSILSNKMFPMDIQSPSITLHLDRLLLTSNFPPTSFDLPADYKVIESPPRSDPSLITRTEHSSLVQRGCYSQIPAQVIKRVEPYSEIADEAHRGGEVYVYLWIDDKGTATVSLIKGQPMLVESVKQALTKQEYAPAHCGSNTVPSMIWLQYDFTYLHSGSFVTVCDGSRDSNPSCEDD